MLKARIINPIDNVAIALINIKPETVVSFKMGERTEEIKVREKIPFGHKFAIRRIENGEGIIKYGEKIGMATKSIDVGFHVHVHNVESLRGRGDLEENKDNF